MNDWCALLVVVTSRRGILDSPRSMTLDGEEAGMRENIIRGDT